MATPRRRVGRDRGQAGDRLPDTGGSPRTGRLAQGSGGQMSDEPMVVCVMLVNGRAEMVKRAVRSFQAQSYESRRLLIWDSTPGAYQRHPEDYSIVHVPVISADVSIGALRNAAAQWIARYRGDSDLIAH